MVNKGKNIAGNTQKLVISRKHVRNNPNVPRLANLMKKMVLWYWKGTRITFTPIWKHHMKHKIWVEIF